MINIKLYSLLFLFFLKTLYSDPIEIDVTKGTIEPLPIAITKFNYKSIKEKIISQQIYEIVSNDLTNSGLFRKISNNAKINCVTSSATFGSLNCLKYLVEEAKVPLNNYRAVACARYFGYTECLHYLREKGSPEPTDAQYAGLVAYMIDYMSAIEQQ